ncbi:hypothetical protein [Streptomyces sp. GbtcB6]|uniref:hypothetical protein n=1 Tax=Streptomyces sp. GbtcB6 TaxID=2824751 RepID=UPI001C300961|nr:hypothetical protein [Streptomyces sp. GbtcB6]
MPRNTPSPRVCRDCDGFARAAITTGTRNPDGTRTTLTVTCSACHGTGTTAPTPALVRIGR